MKSESKVTLTDIENIFGKRTAGAEKGFKFFSVLVPLVERDGKLYLLYEVRAGHMETQPGDVCFPGGRLEEGEDPCDCAVRETREEIGIGRENIRIISRLDTIYTHSNFLMYCYLGIIDGSAVDNVRLNRDEVEEIFLVSVDKIRKQPPEIYINEILSKIDENFPYDKIRGGKKYPWRRGSEQVPLYDIDGRVIWGLTGRITRAFVDVINHHIGIC